MTKILLYGGTFDPPHISHTQLPFAALRELDFDQVLYVPAFQSPLKSSPHSSTAHRLGMLQLALADCKWAEISTIELDRGGTSYTIDTIESLQRNGDEIRLLIGADQWAQFQQWHRWEDIIRLANPAIMPRVGFDSVDCKDDRILPIDTLPCVSTEIRSFISAGKPIDSLVTLEVAQYIAKHQLYL